MGRWGEIRGKYKYSIIITPITLYPDKMYWLSIFNGTNDYWFWSRTSNTGICGYVFDGIWDSGNFGDLAFNLTDDYNQQQVPEPGTMMLMSSVLLGVAIAKKRRNKFN